MTESQTPPVEVEESGSNVVVSITFPGVGKSQTPAIGQAQSGEVQTVTISGG